MSTQTQPKKAQASNRAESGSPRSKRKGQKQLGSTDFFQGLEILESISDGFVALDTQMNYLYINPRAAQILGRAPENLIGKNLWSEHPEAVEMAFGKACRRALETQQLIVLEDYYSPWDRWFENRIHPSRHGLSIFFTDITERRRTEDALQRTESLLRTVLNSVPLTIFATDEKGMFTLSEGKGLESIGLRSGQHVGISALEVYGAIPVRQQDGQLINGQDAIRRALAGETLTAFTEMLGAHFENRVGPLRDPAGNIIGIVGVALDITERKRAEQALYESERRLQLLTESIPDMIWSARPDGTSDYYNQRFLKYLGKSSEEMSGWAWLDTLHPDDRERSIAAWMEAVRTGGAYETEYRIRRASDGQYRWHLSRATALRDSTGKTIRWYGTHTDIDDLKQAQEQLHETTQRLEQLSRRQLELQETERRTIARELHDQIGQMLTALNLTLEMSTQMPPEQAVRKVQQAKGIVDELLTRVSSLSLQLRPPVLDDLGLLPALIWHISRYEEQTGIDVDLKQIGVKGKRFDPQIETTAYRIVQEALTNTARHARAEHIRLEVRASAKILALTVGDDGRGFNRMARPGKLSSGLSGMQERVGLMGGTFEIQTAPGKGTRLSVQLPLKDKRL
jgi:PAS domain S-box-containing protein